MLRGLRLDCWWDNAARPAVSAPLGDFFGRPGHMAIRERALRQPRGTSSSLRPHAVPHRQKMTITNQSENTASLLRNRLDPRRPPRPECSTPRPLAAREPHHAAGGLHVCRGSRDAALPRLQLRRHRQPRHYFRSWWGEGEVKVYLDGDPVLPTLCGTGTEDYIGTGWGQGHYAAATRAARGRRAALSTASTATHPRPHLLPPRLPRDDPADRLLGPGHHSPVPPPRARRSTRTAPAASPSTSRRTAASSPTAFRAPGRLVELRLLLPGRPGQRPARAGPRRGAHRRPHGEAPRCRSKEVVSC